MLDSLIEIDKRSLSFRFGFDNKKFNNVIMIATNLHWSHNSTNLKINVLDYIHKLCENYQSTMFLIKPHPFDKSFKKSLDFDRIDNLIYLDQYILNMVGWPLSRIIKGCDGVITTFSSIMADAECAKVPIAMFPHENIQKLNANHIDVDSLIPQSISLGKIQVVSKKLIHEGRLPLFKLNPNKFHDQWHQKNHEFLITFYNSLHLPCKKIQEGLCQILLEKNFRHWRFHKL